MTGCSIATHLLQAGMKLDYIARFLGHGSLESTQIYTHLAGVDGDQPQPFRNIPRYEKIQLHEDELYWVPEKKKPDTAHD